MILPIIVLGPLYHVENENPSQNPAGFRLANSPFLGTVHSGLFWSKNGHFWGLGRVAKDDFWGPYRVALIFGVLQLHMTNF